MQCCIVLLHSFHVCTGLRRRRRGDWGCDNGLTSSSSAIWPHNAAIQQLFSFKRTCQRQRGACSGPLAPHQISCDTCCSDLLSLTGSARMPSLQQMSPPWDSQSKQNPSSKTVAELNIRVREPAFARSDTQKVGHDADARAKHFTRQRRQKCLFSNNRCSFHRCNMLIYALNYVILWIFVLFFLFCC